MLQNMEAQGQKLPLTSHDARRLLHVKLNTLDLDHGGRILTDKYLHA